MEMLNASPASAISATLFAFACLPSKGIGAALIPTRLYARLRVVHTDFTITSHVRAIIELRTARAGPCCALEQKESTMKSDLFLQQDVVDELAFVPSVKASNIGVAAKGGVVTLTGRVDSYAEKIAAEQAVKHVSGVKGLACELEVELPAFRKRSDADVAAAALSVLFWETTVPPNAVTVTVDHGWATLEGRVEWQYQRENAERAVRHLTGVVGLYNRIHVTPHVATGEVKETIRKAFERSAEFDAGRVAVEVHDGTVTLRGSVRSWLEHEDAARAAYSVPGVITVKNLTTLTL